MRRVVALFAIIVVSALGYYYTFGAAQLTAELRSVVGWHLEELALNGFDVKLTSQHEGSDHFTITCRDTDQIALYLQHHDIDVSDEDVVILKGLEVALDVGYLQGFFHALQADLSLVTLPIHLTQNATPLQQKLFDKLRNEKLFWLHIDINQWLSEYSGYLKDIDVDFNGTQSLRLVLHSGRFGGEYSDSALVSSYFTLDTLLIDKEFGFEVKLNSASSAFHKYPQSRYDFNASYGIKTLKLTLDDSHTLEGEDIALETYALQSDKEMWLLEAGIDGRAGKLKTAWGERHFHIDGLGVELTIHDISTKRLEMLASGEVLTTQADLPPLITPQTQLDIKGVSLSKIYRDGDMKPIDGFHTHGTLSLIGNPDWNLIALQPLLILPSIKTRMELSLSKGLYETLRVMPQLTLLWMSHTPVESNGTMNFVIEHDNGGLRINTKRFL